jgi:hypothetical protein
MEYKKKMRRKKRRTTKKRGGEKDTKEKGKKGREEGDLFLDQSSLQYSERDC